MELNNLKLSAPVPQNDYDLFKATDRHAAAYSAHRRAGQKRHVVIIRRGLSFQVSFSHFDRFIITRVDFSSHPKVKVGPRLGTLLEA